MNSTAPGLARVLGRHAAFALALAAALALRVAVAVAYRPALMFYGDSFQYLANAHPLSFYAFRPVGYSVFLSPFLRLGALGWVAPLQHALALALAVGLYALLLRVRVPRLVALIATLPLLFDGLQLALEQFLMADVLFEALLAAAFGLLLLRPRVSASVAALAGGLAALAAITRTVGLALLPVVLVLAWLRARDGRVRAVALVAMLLPLLLHVAWCSQQSGRFPPPARGGFYLYGRVSTFAQARGADPGDPERALYDPRPPAERPNANFYVWDHGSPAERLRAAHPSEDERDAILARFARRVIAGQPGDYARLIAGDLAHDFAWTRRTGVQDEPFEMWRLPLSVPVDRHVFLGAAPSLAALASPPPQPSAELAPRLRRYADAAATPGPLLALAVLIGLAAPLLHRRRSDRPAATGAVALALAALVSLLVPAATVMFDYRYLLPALVLAPAAAALAFARGPEAANR